MGIKQIRKPLNQFLEEVSKAVKVDQMIVFGSYAEGTATQESDIDVLVVSDDFKNIRSDIRLQSLDEAADRIKPDIIAAGFTKEELERAGKLTILGQVWTSGIRFA